MTLKSTNKVYAVKKLSLKDVSENHKIGFKREIEIMSKLTSEYVVKYYDSWTHNNEFAYIQMELCFTDLRDVLEMKRKEFKRKMFEPMNNIEFYVSCELFKEILEGVNYLHTRNPKIIHRDLKPENILITNNGLNGRFVRIGDFDCSIYHELKSKSTTHSIYIGTEKYMAPEVRSRGRYGTQADLYSLGVMMSEIFEFDLALIDFPYLEQNINLKTNYVNIKKLSQALIREQVVERPDCQKCLVIMKSFALSLDDLSSDQCFIVLKSTLKRLNEDLKMEDSFHKFFIKRKLELFHKNQCYNRVNVKKISQIMLNFLFFLFRSVIILIFILFIHECLGARFDALRCKNYMWPCGPIFLSIFLFIVALLANVKKLSQIMLKFSPFLFRLVIIFIFIIFIYRFLAAIFNAFMVLCGTIFFSLTALFIVFPLYLAIPVILSIIIMLYLIGILFKLLQIICSVIARLGNPARAR